MFNPICSFSSSPFLITPNKTLTFAPAHGLHHKIENIPASADQRAKRIQDEISKKKGASSDHDNPEWTEFQSGLNLQCLLDVAAIGTGPENDFSGFTQFNG
jgi:hypothetical protein